MSKITKKECDIIDAISQINKLKLKNKSTFYSKSKIELEKNLEILRKKLQNEFYKENNVDKEYMKKSRHYLNYLLTQAEAEANETYEQALDNCFDYFLDTEFHERDLDYDIDEARADFKNSPDYFLEVEDFEKQKNKNLNSLKFDAEKELVNSIDTLNIEDLRELKKIYDQIVKIVESNQVDFNNDCKLVY